MMQPPSEPRSLSRTATCRTRSSSLGTPDPALCPGCVSPAVFPLARSLPPSPQPLAPHRSAGSEMLRAIPGREPEHLAHVAEHGTGDHRADAEQAGQAGARGFTAAASFWWHSPSWASRRRRSARNSLASPQRAWAAGPEGVTCSRIRAAFPALISRRMPPGTSPQHRVQPAAGLVTGPGQVTVPFGPDLQHHRVVLGDHRTPGLRPQRRDRHRVGVIRVVLAGVPGLQQPHPGGQLRRHIATRSPAATSCQSGRFPSPAAPSTAQARSGHCRAHASSWPAWDGQPRTRSSPSGSSPRPIATAVCELLRGSIPIITSAISALPPFAPDQGTAAGMPNYSAGARAPFEPRRGTARQAGTSLSSQATSVTGRRIGSPARRAPSTLRPGSLPSRPGPQRHRSQFGGSARVLSHRIRHSASYCRSASP